MNQDNIEPDNALSPENPHEPSADGGPTRRDIFKIAAGAAIGVAAAGAIASPASAGTGPVNPSIPTVNPVTFAITPARVYDSRWTAAASGLPSAKLGKMSPNSNRVVDCAYARGSQGAKLTPGVYVIPTWATAIYFNITVTDCTGNNYLCVAPGDQTTQPATSIINFAAGSTIANASIVSLSTDPTNASHVQAVKVYCGEDAGSCHVLIDIMGYAGEPPLLLL